MSLVTFDSQSTPRLVVHDSALLYSLQREPVTDGEGNEIYQPYTRSDQIVDELKTRGNQSGSGTQVHYDGHTFTVIQPPVEELVSKLLGNPLEGGPIPPKNLAPELQNLTIEKISSFMEGVFLELSHDQSGYKLRAVNSTVQPVVSDGIERVAFLTFIAVGGLLGASGITSLRLTVVDGLLSGGLLAFPAALCANWVKNYLNQEAQQNSPKFS